jgi:hypothetical protein
MPRNLCTEANIKKRKKAFEDMRTTSHNPCKPKLFGKSPRTYGSILPIITKIDKPIINELGRKLIGF